MKFLRNSWLKLLELSQSLFPRIRARTSSPMGSPYSNSSFTGTSAKTSETHPFKFSSKTSKVLFIANRPMSKSLSLTQRAWTILLLMLIFSNPTYVLPMDIPCSVFAHAIPPTTNVSSSSLPRSIAQVLCSLWHHCITYLKGALCLLKPNDILV